MEDFLDKKRNPILEFKFRRYPTIKGIGIVTGHHIVVLQEEDVSKVHNKEILYIGFERV